MWGVVCSAQGRIRNDGPGFVAQDPRLLLEAGLVMKVMDGVQTSVASGLWPANRQRASVP